MRKINILTPRRQIRCTKHVY